MSETTELTGPLVRMLRQTGALAMRMQSGRVKVRGGWMHLCPEGTADILCCQRNKPVTWIETKQPKRAQEDAQREFQRAVEALGHRYIVARSIDEGLEALK